MSRAVVLGLLFTLGIGAHADDYFGTLIGWFQHGTPASYQQVRGFYSGRCFEINERSEPRNSMLGYLEVGGGADPGPGLPAPVTDARLNVMLWHGQPADAFDNEQLFARNRREFENLTSGYWASLSVPSEVPTLNYSVDWEPNGRPDIKVEFVAYQNYFVSRATALISQRYANSWTGATFFAQAGAPLIMCYYFKRLGD